MQGVCMGHKSPNFIGACNLVVALLAAPIGEVFTFLTHLITDCYDEAKLSEQNLTASCLLLKAFQRQDASVTKSKLHHY